METLFTARLLVDGASTRARADAALLVRDGIIAAVGDEARRAAGAATRRVDLSPGVLVPGLIDCHVHLVLDTAPRALFATMHDPLPRAALRAAGNLQAALAAGITTVRDCGGPAEAVLALARAEREGLIRGARVVASGAPVTTTGGHCWMFGLEAEGETGVREAVRRMCRSGADFIKVMVTGGGSTPGTNFMRSQYTAAELAAIADDAHRLGRKVTGHVHGTEGVRMAIEAGFDGLEHCSMLRTSWVDPHYEADLGRAIVDRGIAVCRTVTGGERAPWDEMDERHALWPQFEVLRQLVRAGATVVAGTDAGIDGTGFDGLPVSLASLVRLGGMTSGQALRAATAAAAEALGLASQIGTLEQGKRADFLVVDVDPLEDIRALCSPRAVYRDGIQVPR
jgi:imidazolonepropionase-like amidohydrolase